MVKARNISRAPPKRLATIWEELKPEREMQIFIN
jgi:hypothetical protein